MIRLDFKVWLVGVYFLYVALVDLFDVFYFIITENNYERSWKKMAIANLIGFLIHFLFWLWLWYW